MININHANKYIKFQYLPSLKIYILFLNMSMVLKKGFSPEIVLKVLNSNKRVKRD
jgi:hypothetical protein